MLRAGRSGVQIPVGAKDFYLPDNIQNVSGAYLVSCSVGTGG
jgi:hypothetical protein